jgi:hypothetical protein
LRPGVGARLHQFTAGAIPVVAYLAGWEAPVWAALGLSVAALISMRLVLVGRFYRLFRPAAEEPTPLFDYHGLHRLDEAVRVLLLGTGLAMLLAGEALGWLPILAAAAIDILAGTTSFSFVTVFYAFTKAAVLWVTRRRATSASASPALAGNPNCLVCRSLGSAPYHRCTWCNLPSVRSCCAIQTSMLLTLLLVVAFLLTSALGPLVTKLLITMSIMGVVALGLAITRQTDDLVGTLEHLADERRRSDRRCEFLRRLALADSVQAAAEETIAYLEGNLGARRLSVMVVDGEVLRILAAKGIPTEMAQRVAVPIGERICGRVFASGEPLVLRNVLSERPHEALGVDAGGPAASYPVAAARMSAAGHRVGVINATDKPGGEFTQRELVELQFVAEAAGISLYSQLSRRALERANYASIVSLAVAMEAKDPYINGHSLRVQTWATAVGRELGLAGPRLQILTHAAELHDVGKMAVPDSILQANRKLTDAEWAIVREHPRRGAEMIKHLTFLKNSVPAILHHHERMDGTGYPDGLCGDQIPLEARILAVIDSYDAMTSARAYRRALPHEAAIAELRRSIGTQLDPECVEAFVRRVGEPAMAVMADTLASG